MLARYYSYGLVSVSVRVSLSVSVISRSSVEMAERIELLWRYFLLKFCPKRRAWKISPWQVDRIVNKTRRRSSLLTARRSTL